MLNASHEDEAGQIYERAFSVHKVKDLVHFMQVRGKEFILRFNTSRLLSIQMFNYSLSRFFIQSSEWIYDKKMFLINAFEIRCIQIVNDGISAISSMKEKPRFDSESFQPRDNLITAILQAHAWCNVKNTSWHIPFPPHFPHSPEALCLPIG